MVVPAVLLYEYCLFREAAFKKHFETLNYKRLKYAESSNDYSGTGSRANNITPLMLFLQLDITPSIDYLSTPIELQI